MCLYFVLAIFLSIKNIYNINHNINTFLDIIKIFHFKI